MDKSTPRRIGSRAKVDVTVGDQEESTMRRISTLTTPLLVKIRRMVPRRSLRDGEIGIAHYFQRIF